MQVSASATASGCHTASYQCGHPAGKWPGRSLNQYSEGSQLTQKLDPSVYLCLIRLAGLTRIMDE